MNTRLNLKQTEPGAYTALLGMESYLATTQLSHTHLDLIKIRASQINGCAFCIDMHTREARQHGDTEQRIYGLSAWKDTPFYSAEERALLALTEEVTLITAGVSDTTYNTAVETLGEQYTAQAIMAIITINAWNRIGVTTHLKPASRQKVSV
jgi:AhpD family alkylhydroperoxidase